jgi:hypothetical protein
MNYSSGATGYASLQLAKKNKRKIFREDFVVERHHP